MTSIAYAVKRALRDEMRALAGDGGPLGPAAGRDGYDVRYAPLPSTRRAIYFGGVRTTQVDDAADGKRTLTREAASVVMYIRVTMSSAAAAPDEDVYETADRELERAGDAFGAWLADHRDFAGASTRATINAVYGDYASSDSDVLATMAYTVTVTGYLDLAQGR